MATKRSAVWPFAVASLAMMLLPTRISQRARLTTLIAFAPVRTLASGAHDLVERGWEKLRPSRHADEIERQNEFFRSQVVTLLARNGELASKLEAATATRTAVADPEFELLPADVVLNLDTSPFRQTIVIARGSRDGIEPGMPALYHGHLVGRVHSVSSRTSRVMLATDPGFRAGAVVVPRTESEAQSLACRDVGVFAGTGSERGLLKWLAAEIPVEEGAYVVTSEDPENGVPKGLVLGRVTGIERGRGPSPRVEVTPIVNPKGLEFVLILKAKP